MNTDSTTPLDLIDTPTLARELGLTKIALERWRSDGSGPRFVHIGRKVRYARADVRAWIEANNPPAERAADEE